MAFEYAVLRAVPRVDRGECLNVGVVLYCQNADYLRVLLHVDEARLRSLDPSVDVDAVRSALAGVQAVCAGDAVAGPAAAGARPGPLFAVPPSPGRAVLRGDRPEAG